MADSELMKSTNNNSREFELTTTGSFVNDGLQSIKLGVVTIFGIIAPGIWFSTTTLIYLTYLFGGETLTDIRTNADHFVSVAGPYIGSVIGFLLVYVCGAVLRIPPPDYPDRLSPWKRDADSPINKKDRFPYEELPIYLSDRGLHGLAEMVPWSQAKEGKRSKTFLHFVKLYLSHKDPDMANHLAKQEAFIRLMSGVFYAALYSSILFVICLMAVLLSSGIEFYNDLLKISLIVFFLNILVSVGILKAFHYQRLRELVMILSAYYIVGPIEKSPYNKVHRGR